MSDIAKTMDLIKGVVAIHGKISPLGKTQPAMCSLCKSLFITNSKCHFRRDEYNRETLLCERCFVHLKPLFN